MSSFNSFDNLYTALNDPSLTRPIAPKETEKQSNIQKALDSIKFQGESLDNLEKKAARLLSFSGSLSEKNNCPKQEVSETKETHASSNSLRKSLTNFAYDRVEAIVEWGVEKKVNSKLTPLTGLEYKDLKNLDDENLDATVHKATSHIANQGLKPLLGIEFADLEKIDETNYQEVVMKMTSHLSGKLTGLTSEEIGDIEKAIDIAIERAFPEGEKKPISISSIKQNISDLMTMYRAKKAINKGVEHVTGLATTDWKNMKNGTKILAQQFISDEKPSFVQDIQNKLALAESQESFSKLTTQFNNIKETGQGYLSGLKDGVSNFLNEGELPIEERVAAYLLPKNGT